jgi:SAM-dependent methyltransferase
MVATVPSPIAADGFARTRASHIAAAASLVGLAAGKIPTNEQLAHLAWHLGALEPSELQLVHEVTPRPRARSVCRVAHCPAPDDLDEILPLPHPLDYEWRFEPRTRLMLARRCERLAGYDGPVALLGTPTLAPALRGHAGGVLLLDTNARLIAALASAGQLSPIQWIAADIVTFSFPSDWQHRAAVVVCDPPWYPEGFAAFLRTAAQLVRPGGSVLLSLPDQLTRPTVTGELNDLRGLARHLRLAISAIERHAVRYRTPFFEYRALGAAGVHLIPFDWRAGTLWQLTSSATTPATSPVCPRAPTASKTATEITIGDVRLRVLHHGSVLPGSLALRSVVPGDVLPTVSRRHPARGSATLWTSGNTVLNCADPDLVGRFLSQISDVDWNRLTADSDQLACGFAGRYHLPIDDVRRTLNKIRNVVALERGDRAAYRAAS